MPSTEPNRLEIEAAHRIAIDSRLNLTSAPLALAIAEALAQAREGASLAGPRSKATATVNVSARAWREDPEVEAHARRQVRLSWADQLEKHRARPVGWPAIEVTPTRYPTSYAAGEQDPTPCPLEDADYVVVSLAGPTVPEDENQ